MNRPPRRATQVRAEARIWTRLLGILGILALFWVVPLAGAWLIVWAAQNGALG